MRDSPIPLKDLRPELPVDFSRIVHRCLEKDPNRRFQTIRDLWNELEDLQKATMASSTGPKGDGEDSRIKSIAVLPLSNLSRLAEEEYFADRFLLAVKDSGFTP